MDYRKEFEEAVKAEMIATLATSENGRVTMRTVSPSLFDGNVLIFTGSESVKYKQLAVNPLCCIQIGTFFAEAKAVFFGATMKPENEKLREAYSAKYVDAFDENVPFGGRSSEFVLLEVMKISGWEFENGIPVKPFELVIG